MHRRKYVAPVIIAAVMCAYYIGFAIVVGREPALPLWVKLSGIVIPVILCGAVIGVLVQRIREIKSGEEDDLDRY